MFPDSTISPGFNFLPLTQHAVGAGMLVKNEMVTLDLEISGGQESEEREGLMFPRPSRF